MNYYNEFDPNAAEWLRQLISDGLIPPGHVDTRSITDVLPSDLAGYTQCHFFAGIGGWPLALQLAGLPSDFPVWTGSCPCQPFSAAGKRRGTSDERHLWPQFFRLIAECSPPVVFGEQVASKDGREWLAGVRADLEGVGYAVGAADQCAAGVNAPHIRQRLFWGGVRVVHTTLPEGERFRPFQEHVLGAPNATEWLADDLGSGLQERGSNPGVQPEEVGSFEGKAVVGGRYVFGVADSDGRKPRDGGVQPGREYGLEPEDGEPGGVDFSDGRGLEEREERDREQKPGVKAQLGADALGPGVPGFWDRFTVIRCRDGKLRRTPPRPEPGVFPVVDGVPTDLGGMWVEGLGVYPLAQGVKGRVMLLRGAGNAIVPQVAAEFIQVFVAATHDAR